MAERKTTGGTSSRSRSTVQDPQKKAAREQSALKKKREAQAKERAEWLSAFFWAVALFVFIFIFFWPVKIYETPMKPAYANGRFVLMSRWESFSGKLSAGAVVVVNAEKAQTPNEIRTLRRVIGVPNDRVTIKNGSVYINGTVLTADYGNGETPGAVDIALSDGEYFLLCDDRTHGRDSRDFGVVKKSDIVGKIR
ncbi:signal peptidase I [Clostridia bacterium]|nr:signal peptidase I [Clostridia bacterium]